MNRRDDIAAAELAALVGSDLNEIDQKRLDGPKAVQIHPRDLLRNQPQARQTTNNTIIPQQAIVEPPKSRPAGSEVIGTQQVNVRELMIPTDSGDKQLNEAIKKYSQGAAAPPPPRSNLPIEPQPKMQMGGATPVQQNDSGLIIQLLQEINQKLDLLIKRAKIKPRYKEKK